MHFSFHARPCPIPLSDDSLALHNLQFCSRMRREDRSIPLFHIHHLEARCLARRSLLEKSNTILVLLFGILPKMKAAKPFE